MELLRLTPLFSSPQLWTSCVHQGSFQNTGFLDQTGEVCIPETHLILKFRAQGMQPFCEGKTNYRRRERREEEGLQEEGVQNLKNIAQYFSSSSQAVFSIAWQHDKNKTKLRRSETRVHDNNKPTSGTQQLVHDNEYWQLLCK
jgi:hypothetical protein